MADNQTLYFVNHGEGLLHSHHCPLISGDWTWSLEKPSLCFRCASGEYRPQTWHVKPKVWKPQKLPDGARLCMPPARYNLSYPWALRKDGSWEPWDLQSPAYGFVAKADEGYPGAIYLEVASYRGPQRIVKDLVSHFCYTLHGCANGVIAQPYTSVP